jgi:glycosyltransferase involved in cell wall biosynthesis
LSRNLPEMATPQVSVVVPAFNAETTIVAAVESALGQTFDDLEVIVVDDDSTDATMERLAGIGDPRLRLLRTAHGGVARARNQGMDAARGQFIAFLDADDMWTPDKLEAQVQALSSDPSAWAVYSWTVFCDTDGRYLFAKAPEYLSGDVYSELLTTFFLASGSNALARRACVESIGRFDETAEPVEDWEYWLRCAKKGRFALVPRYQVLYRFSIGSASTAVERYQRAIERVAEREFAGAPAALRRRRAECLSNAKRHACLLYMARTVAQDAHRRSGKALFESIAQRPASLASGPTLALLGAWAVLGFFPRSKRIGAARELLRRYGRWMKRAKGDLRTAVPARLLERV